MMENPQEAAFQGSFFMSECYETRVLHERDRGTRSAPC